MTDRTPRTAAIHDAIAIAVRPADRTVLLGRELDAAVQKALDEQRERIAAAVRERAEQFLPHGAIRAVLIVIAHDIRSGGIGGEQSEDGRGEQK